MQRVQSLPLNQTLRWMCKFPLDKTMFTETIAVVLCICNKIENGNRE